MNPTAHFHRLDNFHMPWLYFVTAFNAKRGHRQIGPEVVGFMDDFGRFVPRRIIQ